jgi:hypothetical protein
MKRFARVPNQGYCPTRGSSACPCRRMISHLRPSSDDGCRCNCCGEEISVVEKTMAELTLTKDLIRSIGSFR